MRIRALETKQKEQIRIKDSQRQLLSRVEQDRPLNLAQYHAWKSLSKNEKVLAKLDNFCDKVLLSRMGFAKYKDGTLDNASKGCYWKRKLVSAGIIRSRRRSRFIRECTKDEFKLFTLDNRRLKYYDGALWEETVAEFTTTTFPFTASSDRPKRKHVIEPIKVKPYLQFDMVAWWANDGAD